MFFDGHGRRGNNDVMTSCIFDGVFSLVVGYLAGMDGYGQKIVVVDMGENLYDDLLSCHMIDISFFLCPCAFSINFSAFCFLGSSPIHNTRMLTVEQLIPSLDSGSCERNST